MVIPAGRVLYRIHHTNFDPVFFGSGAGNPPTYRFDSASGIFGVLYVRKALAGAFAETLLRNPQRLMIAASEIASRSVTQLLCEHDLRLVMMYGPALQVLGTDNTVSTGLYEQCGLWADALWNHPEAPDGIAYLSRHDPGEVCFAVFERSSLSIITKSSRALMAMSGEVPALLERYGKSIAPAI